MMKRLVFMLIFLLSVILIAYAGSRRPLQSPEEIAASQQEIQVKLNELEARVAKLQAELNLSEELLEHGEGQRIQIAAHLYQ